MKQLLCIIVIFSLLLACEKENHQDVLVSGSYKGTFQRSSSAADPIAEVTIQINGNKWSGESNINKYPALCKGSYKILSNQSIQFTNECGWTADFDWTLILSNEYQYTIKGDSLIIVRSNNGVSQDLYLLKKQ